MPRIVVENAPPPTSPAPHELPEHLLAWAAGTFDACGTVRAVITSSGTHVALVVRHRVRAVAPTFLRAFGGRVRVGDNAWVASGDVARAFIAAVGPHVRTHAETFALAYDALDITRAAAQRRADAYLLRARLREREHAALTRPSRARPSDAPAPLARPRPSRAAAPSAPPPPL